MDRPAEPTTRRAFLAAGAATLAAPTIIPARAFGANDRVVIGHIGVGGQGAADMRAFLKLPDAAVAAVCDVDRARRDAAARVVGVAGRPCEGFADYRRLLDRKDLDAVVVATPDHWHAAATIHACQAGKDVYCEKPLSLTVAEGRAMVDAARQHGRVVQTGSQQRSSGNFRRACELVRSGALGALKTVLVGLPAANFAGPPVPDATPPTELDYDFWLGSAPQRPYNVKRVHYNFRFFWDYSGGQMTNFGAHDLDIAHWALGMDRSGPDRVEAAAAFHPDHWFEVPTACRVTYTYPGGVAVVVGQGQGDIPGGVTFVGADGSLSVSRSKLTATPEEILRAPADVQLEGSANHHANFLACIKTRARPICDVETGHRSATACHLGNIAIRLGKPVRWDAAAEQIPDDAEAAAMLARPGRSPWSA